MQESLRRTGADLGAYALPALYLFTMTVFGAGIFFFLPFDIVRTCLLVQITVLSWYLIVAAYRGHLFVVVAALAIVGYVLGEHVLFANLSRSPPNYNAMASFLPLLSFLVFIESRLSIRNMLRLLLVIAVGYVAIYVVGNAALIAANRGSNIGLRPDDGVRGVRLYLLAAWASYVAFYGLSWSRGPGAARIALVALGVAALWISGSRTFQALFLLFFLLAAVGWTGRWVRGAVFATFMILTAIMLAGLIFDRWNPYELMAWDASAAYRGFGYRRAIAAIQSYWAFGIGLPTDSETLAQFLKIPRAQLLFPSDLGTVGMTLMLGLPGFVISIAVVFFCTIGSAAMFQSPEVKALQVNAMLCASIGWMSPMLVIETTTIFLSLLIALHVRSGEWRTIVGKRTTATVAADVAQARLRSAG